MTFEELLNIYRYQKKIPPLYVVGAAYVGAIKDDANSEEIDSVEDLDDFKSLENLKKLKEKRDKKRVNNG